MKNSKGITLVTLVLTIVVLLILVAVTIGTLESNGIIGKSKDSKNNYTKSQEEEIIRIAYSGWKLEDLTRK